MKIKDFVVISFNKWTNYFAISSIAQIAFLVFVYCGLCFIKIIVPFCLTILIFSWCNQHVRCIIRFVISFLLKLVIRQIVWSFLIFSCWLKIIIISLLFFLPLTPIHFHFTAILLVTSPQTSVNLAYIAIACVVSMIYLNFIIFVRGLNSTRSLNSFPFKSTIMR